MCWRAWEWRMHGCVIMWIPQWFCSQKNLDKVAKQISHTNTSRCKELILVGKQMVKFSMIYFWSFIFATAGIHQQLMHGVNLISDISVACLLCTPSPSPLQVDGHAPHAHQRNVTNVINWLVEQKDSALLISTTSERLLLVCWHFV